VFALSAGGVVWGVVSAMIVSREIIDFMVAARDGGWSILEIAAELGLKPSTVQYYLKRQALEKRVRDIVKKLLEEQDIVEIDVEEVVDKTIRHKEKWNRESYTDIAESYLRRLQK